LSKSRQKAKKTVEQELNELREMDDFMRSQVENFQYKINCKFKNKKQKELHQSIMDNRITFVRGSAGTGKTLISLMAALDCLKDKTKNIGQIILTKPIVEITSQKGLGALPGDINEKTLAYYTHFYDNLTKLIGTYQTKFLKDRNFIKETVLNYLRGSTFGQYTADGESIGSFCIFDESQNCTITEMKTFISRMGENSKLVILGDTDQIDLRLNKGEKCGLEDAIDRLNGIPGIGVIEFTEEDIVRDPFLVEIMKRYKNS
jgi:phosphate starvation-inducible protein PhoH and related proteins